MELLLNCLFFLFFGRFLRSYNTIWKREIILVIIIFLLLNFQIKIAKNWIIIWKNYILRRLFNVIHYRILLLSFRLVYFAFKQLNIWRQTIILNQLNWQLRLIGIAIRKTIILVLNNTFALLFRIIVFKTKENAIFGVILKIIVGTFQIRRLFLQRILTFRIVKINQILDWI